MILEAHEHSYERLWPVYNEQVTAHNYSNPKAPVHLISGTAGCNEDLGECFNPILGAKGSIVSAFHVRTTWLYSLRIEGAMHEHKGTQCMPYTTNHALILYLA